MKEPKFKGSFEPKAYESLQGLAREFGYHLAYEPLTFKIKIEQNYTPDFVLSDFNHPNPRTMFIETKGYFRYEDQKKAKAFRKDYPDVEYYILFERNNPIRKGSKTTYLDWAEKNGIKAAIGPEVPKGWFL